jgi:hypothetical protein
MSGLLDELNTQKQEVARIEALKDFYTPENIELKTNLTGDQVRAIASAEAVGKYCLKKWKVNRQVLFDFTLGYKLHAVSSPPSKMNGRDMAGKVLSTDKAEEKRSMGLLGPRTQP